MKSEPGSKFCLHVVIFLVLTFCFGLLPPCGLTEKRLKILGVFVGMLYGWTFISFFLAEHDLSGGARLHRICHAHGRHCRGVQQRRRAVYHFRPGIHRILQ